MTSKYYLGWVREKVECEFRRRKQEPDVHNKGSGRCTYTERREWVILARFGLKRSEWLEHQREWREWRPC